MSSKISGALGLRSYLPAAKEVFPQSPTSARQPNQPSLLFPTAPTKHAPEFHYRSLHYPFCRKLQQRNLPNSPPLGPGKFSRLASAALSRRSLPAEFYIPGAGSPDARHRLGANYRASKAPPDSGSPGY